MDALVSIDAHFKNIQFVEDGLKGSKRTEQPTLGAASGQDRKDNDQPYEQGDKNAGLQDGFR